MKKLLMYINTLKFLKPSQVYYRLRKMMKMECSLGTPAGSFRQDGTVCPIPALDFDPVFLARFPAAELMEGRITLLHETENFSQNQSWEFPEKTALWNYNLHYFEYLFPLVHKWKTTGEAACLEKFQELIRGWIRRNPPSQGCGWAPYPISLRLVNWLNCYAYLKDDLDGAFAEEMLKSMQAQYRFLCNHLEKDLLGNHYFENLKALILCGLFFGDDGTVDPALREFRVQCAEQILPDGMHFELSPMYHKLILEDLIRVAAALRCAQKQDAELESFLQPMLDAAYSLEEGLDRVPLFNDSGDNVAKSLNALVSSAKELFSLTPKFRAQLPDSGYYIFQNNGWKLIVDAGQPGPDYLPGHAHCDAMSFELFHHGQPVLVNCGTYAYQCEDRLFYKNTSAHNTVMRKGIEQSQCWSSFRMAKRAKVSVLEAEDDSILMETRDQEKGVIQRRIAIRADEILIQDRSLGQTLQAFVHCICPIREISPGHYVSDGLRFAISQSQTAQLLQMPYAPDYGRNQPISVLAAEGQDMLECRIHLS